MSREAMQMALEALESDPISHTGLVNRKQAITALRQALDTEQESVECMCVICKLGKRKWVGLTAYEIQEIHSGNQHWGNFACAIEAKLKEKNHG